MSVQLSESMKRLSAADDVAADVAEGGDLLLHPGGGLVDDAVIVERLGDEARRRASARSAPAGCWPRCGRPSAC